MRQYMMLQYGELEDKMHIVQYDLERCVDDFVFMCFFVGNDFLPHLPSLNIRDGSIDHMISLYIEILPTMEDYLTDCGKLNLAQVEQFLEYLGGIEDQVFKNRLEREAKRRTELDQLRQMEEKEVPASSGPAEQMGAELAAGPDSSRAPAQAVKAEASDTNAWHAQLLAQSFSMDLDTIDAPAQPAISGGGEGGGQPQKSKGGKQVDKEFYQALKDRLNSRLDLGEAMADTVRLGEGPHWKQRYYFEKFKVKQDDLVDFLQRIRRGYIEGLCWVLVYYYQGCVSWTWFYPYHYAPFASDLIGKRFTWQAVILLPFIDEPRLVRILAPLLKQLQPNEKVRNRRGCELMFGHKDDKSLFHAVQLAQAAFEAGHTGMKQAVRGGGLHKSPMFGFLEGWQLGGANREVTSPIEGLPDVEESHAISAQFQDPEIAPHVSKLLPGIREAGIVINAADMDEQSRMKGFG